VLHAHPGNLFGGIETMLVTIARHRGGAQRHTFALCFDGRLAQELSAAGARLARLGPARLSRPWTVSRVRQALLAELGEQAPHAVICHSPWGLTVFGPSVRRANLPLALWLHGAPARGSWLDRFAARRQPDLLVCNSHYTAQAAALLFPGPAEVIYPPVEPPSKRPRSTREHLRGSLGAGATDTVILQVSRLEAWKGHRLLLDALGRLAGIRGWTCWIVGGSQRPEEARYLEELRTTARRLGVEHVVRFLGERRDVPDLMAAADVLCQPNVEPEPFGIVFIEALQAGLPVVATSLGGAREIVTPECGVLVPPGDPGSLADVLRSLAAEPARRDALGAGGPARARALCDPEQQLARLAAAVAGVRRIEFDQPVP
jgi:glycosyltransferase involved in cell wall biosynthesis